MQSKDISVEGYELSDTEVELVSGGRGSGRGSTYSRHMTLNAAQTNDAGDIEIHDSDDWDSATAPQLE